MADNSSPAVFLDRDGTLMRDVDYCGNPKDVDVFPGAPEALQTLRNRGYKLFIITNQSGIGRGFFTEEQYHEVEREVLRQLGEVLIDATYFCPHGPDHVCGCRKPEPGMVFQAAHDHNLDLARSFFVGDKDSDIQCGRGAGVKTILVHTGYGQYADQSAADFVATDLAAAANFIGLVSNE
ncbi:MAG: HAD family hydrolase [Verrucomicrobiota bacterium]|nr:HAD family hydrolase [Verrucomicrobiota bacterium]